MPVPPILSKRPVTDDVWNLALERTRHAMGMFDHAAVLFSGGKDSTATLHVVLEVAAELGRLPLRVIFFDEEAIPYQTEQYVRRVAGWPEITLEWYCLPVQHRNACSKTSPYWWPWAPEAADLWCRPMPPEGRTALPGFPTEPPAARLSIPDANGLLFDPQQYGTCAMFMGIRAAESLTRYRAVARRTEENYIVSHPWQGAAGKGNTWKVYPIYDWTTADVWTAPSQFGWDYNRAYDALEMAGIPAHQQRCSPAFGEEPLWKLWTYAHCFPEVWDKMTARVPGAAAAARYATTELYGYGAMAKPPGVRWPEWLARSLAKWPPKQAAQVAERISEELHWHYRKTTDPLVEYARHPNTGLSWQFLLRIAERGDFKARRKGQGGPPPGSPQRATWERAYAEERAKLEADGRMEELR